MNARRDRTERGAISMTLKTGSQSFSETTAQPPVIGFCRRDGFSLSAWLNQGLPIEVAKAIDRLRLDVFRTGKGAVAEVSVDQGSPDFRDRIYECVLAPVPSKATSLRGNGEPSTRIDTIMVTARDVSEARHAEESLRESERQYRLLAENSTDVISRHDPSGVYLYVSPAVKSILGYEPEEIIGRSAYEFIHPDDIAGVGQTHTDILATNDLHSVTLRSRKKDGEYLWIETTTRAVRDPGTGQVVEIQCSTRDITPRHRAEELLKLQNARLEEVARSERLAHETLKQAEVQLVQSEKLSALGQMVAGVAHEINNPLAFVNNNVAVLQRDLEAMRALIKLYQEADGVLETERPELFEKVRALIEEVDLPYILENLEKLTTRSREGLRRIQQIVKDLREFARLDDGDLQAVDLNLGVRSTINMISGQAKKLGIEIKTNLVPLPLVTCYPGKINQVIMNLLVNAIDASSRGSEVIVTTADETENASIGASTSAVLLSVRDSGTGIDPKILERIFDPFFTTKPIGQGTGLGLSISYGIVKAQGGSITVDSVNGQGSTFTIRLPVTPQVPLARPA